MLYNQKSNERESFKEGIWKDQKIRYSPNRIIIKFKAGGIQPDSLSSVIDSILNAIPNGKILRPPGSTGRMVIYVNPETDLLNLAKELSSRDDIEYAEPDVIDKAQLTPNDTRFTDQWAHTTMDSPNAWALETGSNQVLIGIIDSGISMDGLGNLNHPDLDLAGRYILGTDFIDGGTPRDLNGHGTHVAGIAAAETNNAQGVAGMNWDTPVYICRTLDDSGNGSAADFADAVEEIVDFATAHSYRAVINYSGGGADSQVKRDACDYANNHGMILCAAAGNDFGGAVIFPAAYSVVFDGVIAVGSTNDDDTVSDFSNVGPEVTVVAPGRGILSTTPTYSVFLTTAIGLPQNFGLLDGTSMATPYVTGLVALMWSRHPSFTNTRIRQCLTDTALKLGAGTFDNTWGHGRIRPEAALRCGDFVFPTLFTRFTDFTRFTRFTPFTGFTRFTWFTRFTPFTLFTRFSRFTPFTLFTRFTPFTPFQPFTEFREERIIEPFIVFNNVVLEPSVLKIENFEELKDYTEHLKNFGIDRIDFLSTANVDELSNNAQIGPQDAAYVISTAQNLLRRLAKKDV